MIISARPSTYRSPELGSSYEKLDVWNDVETNELNIRLMPN